MPRPRKKDPLARLARRLGLAKPMPEERPRRIFRDSDFQEDILARDPGGSVIVDPNWLHERRNGVLVIDNPYYLEKSGFAPLAEEKIAQLHAADDRASKRGMPIVEQQERERQAWERAIDALPGALKTTIAEAVQGIHEAEQDLLTTRQRLAEQGDGELEIWAERRARLSSKEAALEALVKERKMIYRQLCARASEMLVSIFERQEAEAEQVHQSAKRGYQRLLADWRTRLAQLAADRRAIGTARAANDADPIEVERRFGPIVSPQVDHEAEKRARLDAQYKMTQLLRAGVEPPGTPEPRRRPR